MYCLTGQASNGGKVSEYEIIKWISRSRARSAAWKTRSGVRLPQAIETQMVVYLVPRSCCGYVCAVRGIVGSGLGFKWDEKAERASIA